MPTSDEKKPLSHTLLAGGIAGFVESSICHPLDTIKTRMQLRNNHVESVGTRLKHSLVEPAVLHMRHSMVEPAFRLKHSLVEPANLIKLRRHSYAEPSLMRSNVGTGNVAPVTITSNESGITSSKVITAGSHGGDIVSPKHHAAAKAIGFGTDRINRCVASSTTPTKKASQSLTKSISIKNNAAKCWWNLPKYNRRNNIASNTSNRTFQSRVEIIPKSMSINNTMVNKTMMTAAAMTFGAGDQGFATSTSMTKKKTPSFTTSASMGRKNVAGYWWNLPKHNHFLNIPADMPNRFLQTRRASSPLKSSTNTIQNKSDIVVSPTKNVVNGGNKATVNTNFASWWTWRKSLPATIWGQGHSSKLAAWWQPIIGSYNNKHGRRMHATFILNSTSNVVRKGPLGPIGTARKIIRKEGFLSLYKGLSAVYVGIIPKMAIRFVSFEQYKDIIKMHASLGDGATNFTAGLLTGLTEAVLIVTPAEVCKIRMQSQRHSLLDPVEANTRKYGNVVQTAVTIIREEGCSALYKGVVPTMLRQGCNQAVNFTAYNAMKNYWLERQQQQYLQHCESRRQDNQTHKESLRQQCQQLPGTMSLLMGGVSGAMGPLVNNPLDVVKTRLQKQNTTKSAKNPPKYTGLVQACFRIANEEGAGALWKGITPRLMRIVPGQAITFTTYESVCRWL